MDIKPVICSKGTPISNSKVVEVRVVLEQIFQQPLLSEISTVGRDAKAAIRFNAATWSFIRRSSKPSSSVCTNVPIISDTFSRMC